MSLDIIRSHLRNGELELARHGAVAALTEVTGDESERGMLFGLLARVYTQLGRPSDAIEAAEKASERTDHWEVRLALGEAMLAIGEPVGARAVLSEAFKRQCAATGREADVLGEILLGSALADTSRAAGDPTAGLAIAERTVSMARTCTGSQSIETANSLLALGMCLYGCGKVPEAKAALTEALEIRQDPSQPNPETIEVAAILDGLGIVARARTRPFVAVKHHTEALRIWVKNLGPDAGPIGACRHSRAQAIHRTGDFRAALKEMEEAVRITALTLGPDHVDTWIARFEYARIDLDVGNIFEGMAGMQKATAKVRKRLGSEHPVVAAMERFL